MLINPTSCSAIPVHKNYFCLITVSEVCVFMYCKVCVSVGINNSLLESALQRCVCVHTQIFGSNILYVSASCVAGSGEHRGLDVNSSPECCLLVDLVLVWRRCSYPLVQLRGGDDAEHRSALLQQEVTGCFEIGAANTTQSRSAPAHHPFLHQGCIVPFSCGAHSSLNLFTVMLIQKINPCFCFFAGIRPWEALPSATSLRKIQLELAPLGFFLFVFFLSLENIWAFFFLFVLLLFGGEDNNKTRNPLKNNLCSF